MSLKGSNQHFTGAASELYVAYKATESGFIVNYPLFTQSKYDLLIDTGSRILKVQVKKAVKFSVRGHEYVQIRLGGCGRPEYKANDYDYVAVVYNEHIWMLPYKDTEGHKSMSFSIFSDCSKSYEYLTNHTFESFSEKVNENYYD